MNHLLYHQVVSAAETGRTEQTQTVKTKLPNRRARSFPIDPLLPESITQAWKRLAIGHVAPEEEA